MTRAYDGRGGPFCPVARHGVGLMEIAGLFYGILLSFVLSAASRNRREGRAHPPMLVYIGHLLLGLTAGAAVLLPIWAGIQLLG